MDWVFHYCLFTDCLYYFNFLPTLWSFWSTNQTTLTFLAPESRYRKEHSNPRLGNLFFWWLVWWLRKSAIFFIVWGLCLVIWVIPGGLTCLDWHHLVLSRTFKSKSSLSCQSDRSRPSIVVFLLVYLWTQIMLVGLRSFTLGSNLAWMV